MRSLSLTRQIVVFAAFALIFVIISIWIFIFSIRDTMNQKAFEESATLMAGRIAAAQEQVALIASDYNNWTDVYWAAMRLDIRLLATNYGITAARGDVFEYAAMFDGPFDEPVAWVTGKGLGPQALFLDDMTVAEIRNAVPKLNIAERATFDFFQYMDGSIVMFSASYLLPEDAALLIESVEAPPAIALIGKVLEPTRLEQIERELSVSALSIHESVPSSDLASLPLLGASLDPVALLSWVPPAPGSQLIEKISPLIVGISFFLVVTTFIFTRMLLTSANALLKKEAEAGELARTDILTGLHNRLALLEKLTRISQDHVDQLAIVVLDLDRFKQINDVVGHSGGDLFLREFAERVKSVCGQRCFVARNGGDEFVVVFWGGCELAETVSRKIANLDSIFSEPIRCAGFLFDVNVSKGIAFSRDGDLSAEELLRRADRAMYRSKSQKGLGSVIYDEEMKIRDQRENRIEKALRSALTRGGEFSITYQPIVNAIHTDSLVRLEALARWESPDLGWVSPGEFIPVAEARGLILPIGWVVLDLVCRDLKELSDFNVSINVSPIQLMTPGFAYDFWGRVSHHGIDCERIEIEITENVALQDENLIGEQLRILRSVGFTIALDDFGTGFTSVGYLGRMPFDTIKIDRSLLATDESSGERSSVINAMIELSHSMGMTVVAEGVEKEEELSRLRMYGCDFIQGYLTGRPDCLSSVRKKLLTATG